MDLLWNSFPWNTTFLSFNLFSFIFIPIFMFVWSWLNLLLVSCLCWVSSSLSWNSPVKSFIKNHGSFHLSFKSLKFLNFFICWFTYSSLLDSFNGISSWFGGLSRILLISQWWRSNLWHLIGSRSIQTLSRSNHRSMNTSS